MASVRSSPPRRTMDVQPDGANRLFPQQPHTGTRLSLSDEERRALRRRQKAAQKAAAATADGKAQRRRV